MIDMPVKLAVCFVILGLMVPVVMDVTDDADDEMSLYQLRSEASELEDVIHRAYSEGSIVSLEMDIPFDQSIRLGGTDGDEYTIRLLSEGVMMETLFIDSPVVAVSDGPLEISGNCTVIVDGKHQHADGTGSVRVTLT